MHNSRLVPRPICLFAITRARMSSALLLFYLPTLFPSPVDNTTTIPHFPELGISQICVPPLGIVGIIRLMQRGSLKLMDFLLTSFLVSLSITEVLREQVTKDGIFLAIISFISMLLPYAVGRTMIEPGESVDYCSPDRAARFASRSARYVRMANGSQFFMRH